MNERKSGNWGLSLENVGRGDRAFEGGRPDLLQRNDVLLNQHAIGDAKREGAAADPSDGAEGNARRGRRLTDRAPVRGSEGDQRASRRLAEQERRWADRFGKRDFGAPAALHRALGERDREPSVRD